MITKSRGPFQKICHPNVRSFRNGGTETSRQRDHARKPRRGRRRCPAAGAQRPPPRHVVLRLQNTRQRRRERPEREVASQARGREPAASRLGESVAGGAWRPVLKEVVFGLGRQAPRARRARSHAQSPPHGLLRGRGAAAWQGGATAAGARPSLARFAGLCSAALSPWRVLLGRVTRFTAGEDNVDSAVR